MLMVLDAMRSETGRNSVPMQINVLRSTVGNANGLEKSISIKKTSVKHGVRQFRSGRDLTINEVTLTICWMPLKLRHS